MLAKLWSLLAMISLIGCTPTPVGEQAKLLGTKTYSKEAWAAANQEERGEMVFSFLSQHDHKSLTSSTIKELLGPPTGYYDFDENPAYLVGPSSVESKFGKGYVLAFIAEKNSGKIVEVRIVPEPK